MRKVLAATGAGLLLALGLAITGSPASAAPVPVPGTCSTGWYVNDDETNRMPEQVYGGLQFSGDDLVHHSTNLTVEALTHGTFVASPQPDQDSFFSVEVYGDDGGYATLRWNTVTEKWNMVTGGQFYENVDPAALVDMVEPHKSHHVVSFGVGYTANPPGTVTTVVSSVTFAGTTYALSCDEESPTPTPTPTASETQSPSPTPTATQSESPSATPTATPSQSQGPIEVKSEAPAIGKVTCDQFEFLTPDLRGVDWDIVDTKVVGNTVTIKVTATAQDGYVIVGDTEWTLTFEIPANCTATPAPTEVPTSPAANSGGNLPVTGPSGGAGSLLAMGAAGALLISIGGILLTWARRRRDAGTVESA